MKKYIYEWIAKCTCECFSFVYLCQLCCIWILIQSWCHDLTDPFRPITPRCLLFTSRGLRRGECWEKTGWGLLKARSQHTKVSEREKIQTQKLRVLTCQKGRGCSLQLSGYLIWKALPPKFEHSSERSVLVCPDSCPEQPPANATDRHKKQRLKSQTQSPCPFFFCCLLKKWKRKKVW